MCDNKIVYFSMVAMLIINIILSPKTCNLSGLVYVFVPLFILITLTFAGDMLVIWGLCIMLVCLVLLYAYNTNTVQIKQPATFSYTSLKALAKKNDIPVEIIHNINRYNLKCTEEESKNLYVHLPQKTGFYYTENKTDGTIVIFGHRQDSEPVCKNKNSVLNDEKIKIISSIKNEIVANDINIHNEKQIEKIKTMLFENPNNLIFQNNIKLCEDLCNVLKDFEFDDTLKEHHKLHKTVNLMNKVVDIFNAYKMDDPKVEEPKMEIVEEIVEEIDQ